MPGGALGLRDFVLVVREDQIHAAAVQVDRRFPQQPQRHGGALDVPARPAGSDPEVPRRLAGLGRLPQDEVARVLLGIRVAVDAGAGLDALVVEPRELPVLGKRRDAEVDRPVGGIRVAALAELQDHVDHRAQVGFIGRARVLLDRLESHRRRVFAKCLDVTIRVLPQRDTGLRRRIDRLVVDVREVHHLLDRVTLLVAQRASQRVQAHERAEVPDVAAGVDRQAARVHPHRLAVGRRELFLASREGVEEVHQSGFDGFVGSRTGSSGSAGSSAYVFLIVCSTTADLSPQRTVTCTPPVLSVNWSCMTSPWPFGDLAHGGDERVGKRPAVGGRAAQDLDVFPGNFRREHAIAFVGGHLQLEGLRHELEGFYQPYTLIWRNRAAAFAQSSAICARSGSSPSNLRSSRSRWTNARRSGAP